MMRLGRAAKWLLVFATLVFVMLVVTAPAAVPARLIEMLTAGRIQVQASHGSAWNGQATLVTAGLSGGQSDRLGIRWKIELQHWYRGELAWILGTAGQSLRVVLMPHAWRIETTGFGVPLAALRPFFPGSVANYDWSGQARLISPNFGRTWSEESWQGSARLELHALGVGELSAQPLGGFALDMKPDAGSLVLGLSTFSGPLHLDAQGAWQGKRFSCAGKAKLAPGELVEIGRLLDHFARRTSPGNWSFSCLA